MLTQVQALAVERLYRKLPRDVRRVLLPPLPGAKRPERARGLFGMTGAVSIHIQKVWSTSTSPAYPSRYIWIVAVVTARLYKEPIIRPSGTLGYFDSGEEARTYVVLFNSLLGLDLPVVVTGEDT